MSESTVQHPRRRGRPLYLPWILLLALAALLATASGASAQTAETAAPSPTGDSGLLVTIAARTCPEYTDITANRARNDIQESLRDLGADTPYSDGDQVDPDIEQTSQPNCTPLNDWDFTLGRNYQTRAVDGPWGSLSIVTDPYSTPITTQPSIPLLNSQGEVIPGRQIEAAVTIELSDDQADRASRNNSLWLQGGTPADPILDQKFPGQYGFGALRCAIDNLNGDNVEWIAYPQGTKHVFCFAYYVTPPPTSGEIVIRKEIAEPDAARTTFPFDGNLSFNVGGEFDLSAAGGEPDSETFIRAETRPGEDPWTVTEAVPPDWTLTDLTCVSESGESSAETSVQAATADITLSAGDTVTCTFTNSSEPPQAGLSINKLTEGGVGRFSYTVTPLGEDGATRSAVARTSEEGVATPATPNVISLAPGRYRIVERLPSSDDGSWRLRRVVCNGDVVEPERNGVVVELSAGEGVSCTFTNRFRPETGSIVIRKVTREGVGPAAFLVVPVERELGGSGRRAGGRLALPLGQIRAQAARTTEPGRPVRARGQSTSRLPLGTYFIQELMNPRQWDLESVTCNGQLVPFARGLTAVRLTESRRRVVCTFENVRQPDPTPPTPPEPPTPPTPPEPPTPPAPPQPPTPPAPPTPPTPPTPPSVPVTPATPVAPGPSAVPESRILLTKTASRSSIELGETLTYTIRVRNAGPDIAQQVVVWEQTRGRAIIKSLTTSQGRCRSAPRPRGCFLGELEPGQTVTIRVRAQPTETGNLRNVVAAGSATASTSVRVSRAIERIRVLQRRPAIGFTG